MAEPRRADSSPVLERTADRAGQADTLLVQGLDRYFDGQFEEAIHIWTRVLFLDRTHARARAYIDRARSALAERQRKSDEKLQASQQLLERGQTDAARQLLSEVVASSGDDEQAAALRVRLERLERARVPAAPARLPIGVAPDVLPAWTWRKRSFPLRWIAAAAAAAFLIVATVAGLETWAGGPQEATELTSPAPPPLQVLSSSEVALIRARTLYGRGRLAQALQALDRVDDRSETRSQADALRIEIQRLLLATGRGAASAAQVAR